MNLVRFALIGALGCLLVMPAMAQTTQTTPTKPSPTLTSPTKPTPTPTTPAATSRPAAATPATPVDINSATSEELDKLPGVGKSRAQGIIKNRPYKTTNDLLDRKIIPANVYKGIKDKIVVK